MKNFLILKASKDICGSKVGLVSNNCELIGMTVYSENVVDETSLEQIVKKYEKLGCKFDYIYLCTHGDKHGMETDMSGSPITITWARFSQLICETGILNFDTILLLGCCKGGILQVSIDIMAVCNKINFICGVKWNVEPWDLTTGFIVFIHNIENKKAEPTYAAQKASLATDYTFACYDRDEIEGLTQYENRRYDLFREIGWMDDNGIFIETDATIRENTGF